MKKTRYPFLFYSIYALIFLFIISSGGLLHAESLSIDTEYKITGLAYPNSDFDLSTSTDGSSYYTQRLRLSLTGNLNPNVELYTRISAIGFVGSTVPLSKFDWQKDYPYSNVRFFPYVEHAYLKFSDIYKLPINVTVGKQPVEYGTGLILSDNGAGINALRFNVTYPAKLHSEFFAGNVNNKKNIDIQGLIFNYPLRGHILELSYFEEHDLSKQPYFKSSGLIGTTRFIKTFYDLSYSKSGNWGHYSVEYALQKGGASLVNGTNVEFDGKGFVAQGRLVNEKARLGKVAGFGILAAATGDESFGESTINKAFNPDFTKRYDGLERTGWGDFFASSIYDSYFDVPLYQNQPNFSGFGVFGFGADISPSYGLTFGVAGYYFSASEALNKASPKVTGGGASISGSGLEKLLGIFITGRFDAERYNLGAELDLNATYELSKYFNFRLGYARYTPPTFPDVWSKSNTSEMFRFDTNFKF